jgi:transcriptional regulator with XRE-family HTH domain
MKQLTEWMTANDETDETLAAKAEVSRVNINRIRRGVQKPRTDLAKRLAEITSIPAADFIFGSEA